MPAFLKTIAVTLGKYLIDKATQKKHECICKPDAKPKVKITDINDVVVREVKKEETSELDQLTSLLRTIEKNTK